MDWTNKYLEDRDIHYSRIIASWIEAHGLCWIFDKSFEQWLREEGKLNDDQVSEIKELAVNGKMEWKNNARLFMRKIGQKDY